MKRSLPAVRRLVVKVGSSSLTDGRGRLEEAQVTALARELASAHRRGVRPVLVSSGAVAAGLGPLGLARRPSDMPTLQAAASVGQSILMHAYRREFARRRVPVGQVLLTQDDFVRRTGYLNAHRALERLLALGAIPIVNENDTVAVDEIRFGDNDRLSALVANMVRADLLVILTDTDGIHAGDPRRGATEVIERVDDLDALPRPRAGRAGSAVGSGGMASKIEAARVATASGIAVVVANARRPHVLRDVLAAKPVGTFVPARRRRAASRKLWIAYAQRARGAILIDAGARRALVDGGKSLLPVGVTGCRGSFSAGDAVEVVGPDGGACAKGITNYGSDEIGRIKGRALREGLREVIHRDHLVVLDGAGGR